MKICYLFNRPDAIQDVDIFEGLIDGLELCGSLVDYCYVFLSAVWIFILMVPIHYWGWIGEQLT